MRPTKRDQILEAGRRVLARQGYHSTTISSIVREAKVSRATFYLHFPSKREIFEEMLGRFLDRLAQDVRRIDRTEKEASMGVQLRANLDRVLDTLEANRELTRILMRESLGIDPEFDERLQTFYDRIAQMVVRSLNRGMEMGLVHPCNAPLVAFCIIGQLKEIVTQRLTEGRLSLTRQEIIDQVLAFNLQGLLKVPIRFD